MDKNLYLLWRDSLIHHDIPFPLLHDCQMDLLLTSAEALHRQRPGNMVDFISEARKKFAEQNRYNKPEPLPPITRNPRLVQVSNHIVEKRLYVLRPDSENSNKNRTRNLKEQPGDPPRCMSEPLLPIYSSPKHNVTSKVPLLVNNREAQNEAGHSIPNKPRRTKPVTMVEISPSPTLEKESVRLVEEFVKVDRKREEEERKLFNDSMKQKSVKRRVKRRERLIALTLPNDSELDKTAQETSRIAKTSNIKEIPKQHSMELPSISREFSLVTDTKHNDRAEKCGRRKTRRKKRDKNCRKE